MLAAMGIGVDDIAKVVGVSADAAQALRARDRDRPHRGECQGGRLAVQNRHRERQGQRGGGDLLAEDARRLARGAGRRVPRDPQQQPVGKERTGREGCADCAGWNGLGAPAGQAIRGSRSSDGVRPVLPGLAGAPEDWPVAGAGSADRQGRRRPRRRRVQAAPGRRTWDAGPRRRWRPVVLRHRPRPVRQPGPGDEGPRHPRVVPAGAEEQQDDERRADDADGAAAEPAAPGAVPADRAGAAHG